MPEVALMLSEMTPDARAHAVHLLAKFPSLALTSTRRSPERNRAVGGVAGSLHLEGRAVDVTGGPGVLERALAYVQRDHPAGRRGGPTEAFIESTGPQIVGGGSTGRHLHVAW